MSCCKGRDETKYYTGCNECVNHDIHMRQSSTVDSPLCLCRSNGGCLVSTDCNSLRPANTIAIQSCLEPCQCAEEIEWNCYTPPKPSCKWLNNFCKLRRQWSNHARQQNCRCCNCRHRFCEIPFIEYTTSVSNKMRDVSNTYFNTRENGLKKKNACSSIVSYVGSICYNTLVPGPLTLVSLVLFIFFTIGLCCILPVPRRYLYYKRCLTQST